MLLNYKKINNKGFTLVETMVAVLILSLIIVNLMTVVSNTIFSAQYGRDQITANYLAQEVIDAIRNNRDTLVFLSDPVSIDEEWNNFVKPYDDNCSGSYGCYFDVDKIIQGNTPMVCYDYSCGELYFDKDATNTPFYTVNDVENSRKVKTDFNRQIKVKFGDYSNDELVVEVVVNWKNGNLDKSISLKTSILKW
jgi:prepilin-type N-terminal cleavage/methylation domain-containing protein